jgi:ketosteroid isomerase-like protein
MNWFFFEGPWPILVTCLVLEAILLIAVVRTGRVVLLWAVVGLGLLTGGLLLVERLVVTDNERIRETLDGVAAAAAANDLDGVLAYIGPDAKDVRDLATNSLRRIKVREAKIGNDLSIAITQQGGAPSALATFTGRIRAEVHGEALGHDTYVGRFSVGLVKQGDKWLVVAFQRRDLVHP